RRGASTGYRAHCASFPFPFCVPLLSLSSFLYALPWPGSPWGGSSMAAPGAGSIAPPSTSSTCAAGLIGGRTSSGGAADPGAGGTGWLSGAAQAHVDTRPPGGATPPASSTAPTRVVSPVLTSADGTL